MKHHISKLLALPLLALLGFHHSSCTRIEAGHVGVKVNLYASEPSSDDIIAVKGMVFYNPLTTNIYEFPTFVQHKVWTASVDEGSPTNEEFTVTTKDGLSLSFDVGLDYTVKSDQAAVDIFRKYRKDLPEITNEFIRTLVRNAYNSIASGYTAEDMVSKRAEYENQVRAQLIKEMNTGGFEVSQVAIIGKIRMPNTLEEAVNAKIKAVQDAIKAENEKQRIIAEAQKQIEQAKGAAEALRIQAEAEANANKLINSTLTPIVIQKMYIERWDGKLPVYGQTPALFKNIPEK